jgi:uncharacterized protein YbbK (DUF523 family)
LVSGEKRLEHPTRQPNRQDEVPVIRILISACLLGEQVRYDGGHKKQADPRLERWSIEGRLLALCPEMLGGLPVPRPAAEILGGDGRRIWSASAVVRTRDGHDVSEPFRRGARQALAVAREQNVGLAILKQDSPSCGSRHTYDGSFRGLKIAGQGVTAALLTDAGIPVFDETQLDEAEACLNRLLGTNA